MGISRDQSEKKNDVKISNDLIQVVDDLPVSAMEDRNIPKDLEEVTLPISKKDDNHQGKKSAAVEKETTQDRVKQPIESDSKFIQKENTNKIETMGKNEMKSQHPAIKQTISTENDEPKKIKQSENVNVQESTLPTEPKKVKLKKPKILQKEEDKVPEKIELEKSKLIKKEKEEAPEKLNLKNQKSFRKKMK